jgi:hypothetical protein
MTKKLMLALALLAMASVAGANSFTADGTVFEPAYGYNNLDHRFDLINDGDFEFGTCAGGTAWICTTDNNCDWIADLVALGLWNYSGAHIAWLGGFCGGVAGCHTSFCQDIHFEGVGIISWYWMAYVNDAIMHVYVTIDGILFYDFYPQLEDHLLDYQPQSLGWWGPPPAVHTLCFQMDDPGCNENLGDNYFLDYVEVWWGSPAAEASFSAVKSLY